MVNTTLNNISANAEEKTNLSFDGNEKIINKRDVKDTPFKRVITDGGDFFTLGAKAITTIKTEEEADEIEAELKSENWPLMLTIISVMVQETVARLHLDIMEYNAKVEELGKEETNHE